MRGCPRGGGGGGLPECGGGAAGVQLNYLNKPEHYFSHLLGHEGATVAHEEGQAGGRRLCEGEIRVGRGVSNLLGHEGPGALLSALKVRRGGGVSCGCVGGGVGRGQGASQAREGGAGVCGGGGEKNGDGTALVK